MKIRLLGTPLIEYAGYPVEIARKQARALLFRLATDLRPVPREQLAFLFWADIPDATARRNLSQRLSMLRRELPDPALLQTTKAHVQLDPEQCWSDVVEFNRLSAQGLGEGNLDDLQKVASLYRGPFLDGFSLPKNLEFERWLSDHRRIHERLYLNTLLALVDGHSTGGVYGPAIAAASRYLAVDELDENIHRRLIQLYAASGDHNAALRQYERCMMVLKRELGVKPQTETEAVYQALLAGKQPSRLQSEAVQLDWRTQPGLELPLLGREDAMQDLLHAYRSARIGQGQFALVLGEPGIGKTRLVQEFASQLPRKQALVLVGGSQRSTQSSTYQPIIEALRNYLERITTTGMGTSREVDLERLFPGGISPIWLAEASRLMPEFRIMIPDLPELDENISPEVVRVRLVEAFYRLLLALANPLQTIVLFFDDVQWADESTLSWLSYLGGRIRNNRLLVILAYRRSDAERLSTLKSDLFRQRPAIEVRLPSWDVIALQKALAHVTGTVGDSGESEALVRLLLQATRGNPFLVLAMMQELVETNQLKEAWSSASQLPLPHDVGELLRRRQQCLGAISRQLLEAGAVLGSRFEHDLLCQTAGRDEMETIEALQKLVSQHFLDAETNGFRFHHELIRETVLMDMDDWRTQLLHRRAAAALETLHAHALDEVCPQLADHYASAKLPVQAVPYYLQAARTALRVDAVHEVISLLESGLVQLKMLPSGTDRDSDELQMQLILGPALMMARGWTAPGARRAYERAEVLAAQLGDDMRRYVALDGLADIYRASSESESAAKNAQQLLALARRLDDPIYWGRAIYRNSAVDFYRGELTLAREAMTQTLGLDYVRRRRLSGYAETWGDFLPVVRAHLGYTLWLLGFPDQARSKMDEAVAVDLDPEDPFSVCIVSYICCELGIQLRNVNSVRKQAEEQSKIGTKYGFPDVILDANLFRGWVLVQRGKVDQGVEMIQRSVDSLIAKGGFYDFIPHLALLAHARIQVGQFKESLIVLDEALVHSEQTGERYWMAELLRLKGELLAAQGAAAIESERYYRSAIDIARQQTAKSLELRAVMSLNHLLQAQGTEQQQAKAHAMLAETYSWFTEGFDTPDLQEAKAMLDDLKG